MMRRNSISEVISRTCLLLLGLVAVGLLALPGTASAGQYKVVLCAGNNSAKSPAAGSTTPNFDLGDHCGSPDGDPPGGSAFLSIHENQPSGPMSSGAFSEFSWPAPAWTHFRQAGGYTREPGAFNAGWRARFIGTNADGSTFLALNQGSDVADDAGVNRSNSPNFGPHLWPFAYLRDFNRFAFRLECVRAAGCDRTGLGETDANGFVFILSDDYPSRVAATNGAIPFMSGQWVRGIQPVAWNVTEYGSGLRLMRVAIDGVNDFVYDYAAACDTQTTVSNGTSARTFTPCIANNGTSAARRDVNTASYPDGARLLGICSQDFGQWQGYYGSAGETCDRRTVRIDNTAPVAPSNLSATGRAGTFGASWTNPPQEGVAPVAASHYRLQQLSGGSFDSGLVRVAGGAGMQSIASQPAGSDGGYRLTVYLEDAAGNLNPANTAVHTFTIDSTAPETSITEGPAEGSFTTSRAASLKYVSGDPAATFECSLDGPAFVTCPGAGTSLQSLGDGLHRFRVRALNPNGSDPTPAERVWTVDNLPPTTSITSGPAAGGTVRPSQVTFGFAADEQPVTFECRVDTAPFAECTTPEAFPDLADGSHSFDVRATDAAGNRGPAVGRAFIVDGTPPSTTIFSGPASGATIATASPSFAFTADEGGVAYECRVDSAAFTACSSPRQLSGLSDGPHTFEARATDLAGNAGTPAGRSFSVDTQAPDVVITGGPAEGATVRPSAVEWAFTSSDPGAGFECRVDSGAWAVCSSPRAYSGLPDGPHAFAVVAVDRAGNRSQAASRSFNVDGTGPQVGFTSGPANGSTLPSASTGVGFAAGETGVRFECSLDSRAFAPCASPLRLGGLDDGPHSLSVRATDLTGNTGPVATLTFAVDTRAPAPPGFSRTPNDPTADTNAVFGFTGEKGATFECRLDSGGWEHCPATRRYPGLALGIHTLDVRQTDAVGHVSAATRFTWEVVEFTDPNDPRHCALESFRVRVTALGLRVIMRSEVPRLVKIQVFRRGGPFVPQKRLSVYRKRSTPRRTVRLIKASNFQASRKLRNYVRLGRGGGAVTRIVPRVINEVRGCNEGGKVGSRSEPGYVARFTRRAPLRAAMVRR